MIAMTTSSSIRVRAARFTGASLPDSLSITKGAAAPILPRGLAGLILRQSLRCGLADI